MPTKESSLITNAFNARYVANLLIKSGSGIERLSNILMGARVDLNPHQVFAAIEAIENPFSKGRILADEVGLGKTIEASIVIADRWAKGAGKGGTINADIIGDADGNNKNSGANIIVVVPSSLKEQWAEELEEKFYLPTQVLDGDEMIETGKNVIIASYNFCYNHEKELRTINWDLVVFDEAHKLRNLYTESNKIDKVVASIFRDTHKLLLTATPLQNSLLDIYSLVSMIDSNLFLDLESYKERYVQKDNSKELAERLSTIVTRTLRKQVLEYIKYTDRKPITVEFELNQEEKHLYEEVLKFCDEKNDKGKSKVTGLQRMILLKELASSPKALIETAKKMGASSLATMAEHIGISSKLQALDTALTTAFEQLEKIGAEQKAVIFTESLATQKYIQDYLESKYNDQYSRIDILNGSTKNRQYTINRFKSYSNILISTEVGGEGLNLQFCSLVINFDMPWNPQKIEQRIGRCHRYGQKHDVTVINFLCRDNYADARLYDLLHHKLKLFEGVLGASDTVLGLLENIDFEECVVDILLSSRTKEEIDKAFEALQNQLEQEIKQTTQNAKNKVFEYLDKDVANKFKGIGQELDLLMTRKAIMLWELMKYIIGSQGSFSEEDKGVIFHKQRYNGKKLYASSYSMDKHIDSRQQIKIGTPIVDRIINEARSNSELSSGRTEYSVVDNPSLAHLKGKKGWIGLYHIKAKNDWWYNDFVLVGKLEDGTILDFADCENILMSKASGHVSKSHSERDEKTNVLIKHVEVVSDNNMQGLDKVMQDELIVYSKKQADDKTKYFDQYAKSMQGWADDKIDRLDKQLKQHEKKLNEIKLLVKNEKDFAKKMELSSQLKQAESDFAQKRIECIAQQENIRQERDSMIKNARDKISQGYEFRRDFVLEFSVN